ncbi:TolC family protein [bacterium]|nr:TolC family protein [bacterium]
MFEKKNKNIKKYILYPGFIVAILLSANNGFLFAQEVQPTDSASGDTLFINLQDAILTALERNSALNIERLNPKIAHTYVREEGAAFDPELSFTGTITETKTPQTSDTTSDSSPLESQDVLYDVALSGQLPTGTDIELSANIAGDISSIYTDQYTGNIGITVTQSLLKGFGVGYNLARLRKAKVDHEISRLELKAVGEAVVASVERAYWNVFLSKNEMDIQQQSLELAEKQLGESVERVSVGKLAEIELAAVHAEVATRKEAMIDAQSGYEQARLDFLYILNPSEKSAWNVIPVPLDQPFIPKDTLDTIENHEKLAMEYRADLQQANLYMKKNKLDLKRTRNGLLPQLDVFISLGRTTYSGSFSEAIPDLSSEYSEVSGGVVFELPLTLRQARAEHDRTKYTRDQLELAVGNMERLVQRDVRSAYTEVLRSRQQIEATQVTADLEEAKLNAELEKFRVGKSTNFLVLQAQRDFIAAQLSQARAKVAYLNALVNLYLMEGTLLDRRGISVND